MICGFRGNDRIWGLRGNDIILGGRGDDVIRAGDGNDRLLGQPDDDKLFAGRGNDYLNGGPGENSFFTGPGNNKCVDRETDTVTPGCDDTIPKVVALQTDAEQIDTHDTPVTVNATLRMTDDISGIRGDPLIEISHKKTGQRWFIFLSRESGDRMDGTWSGSITMPRYSPQGRWDFRVIAGDRQKNHGSIEPDQLKEAGFPSGFDQVGEGDSTPPRLSDLTVDRTSFDTSASAQTLTFTMRVTDDISGVGSDWFAGPIQINLHADEAAHYRQVRLDLISGNKFDGIYQGTIEFPRYMRKADWDIRPAAVDYAGNVGGLSKSELANGGMPTRISQTSAGDSTAPVLRSLTVPEDPVNLSSEVEIATLRVTDDLAGVGAGNIGVSVQTDEMGYSAWIEQVSGTALDGIYKATISVAADLPDGPYDLQIYISDEAENSEWYQRQDLLDLGFPGFIETDQTP